MKKGLRLWISLAVMLTVAFACLIPGRVYADSADTVPDGVYLDDIAIGGMTREEVQKAVDERIKTLGWREHLP